MSRLGVPTTLRVLGGFALLAFQGRELWLGLITHNHDPWSWITSFLWIAICGAGFRWGGIEVVIAALAMMVAGVFSLVFVDRTWQGVQWGAFTGDLVLLGVFLSLSLRSRRWWPLWAAASQLIEVATHLLRLWDPQFQALAYSSAMVLLTWVDLGAIGFGASADRRTASGFGLSLTGSAGTPPGSSSRPAARAP